MGDTAVTKAAEVILLLREVMKIEGDTPDAMKAVLRNRTGTFWRAPISTTKAAPR